jgi:hypothetical protein
LAINRGVVSHRRPSRFYCEKDGTEERFGYLRLDAENHELVAVQSVLEALMVTFAFMARETHEALALVRHPLPGPLLAKTWQVAFNGTEGLFSEVEFLHYRHGNLGFSILAARAGSTSTKAFAAGGDHHRAAARKNRAVRDSYRVAARLGMAREQRSRRYGRYLDYSISFHL